MIVLWPVMIGTSVKGSIDSLAHKDHSHMSNVEVVRQFQSYTAQGSRLNMSVGIGRVKILDSKSEPLLDFP